MDMASNQLNIDPIEIRRKNLITSDEMPYQTALMFSYDSGEFIEIMDEAVKEANWSEFEERKKISESKGKLRGIGLACYLEGAAPFNERMEIRFDSGGTVTVVAGTHSHGQGHETIFRQMLADMLGLEFEQVRLLQGDTDVAMAGTGTFGSRSSGVGGASIQAASNKIIDKCKIVVAHHLEVAVEDLEFNDGTFTVAGTDKNMSLMNAAKHAQNFMTAPPGLEVGLDEWAAWSPPAPTFPNGCHIAEVEIDPDTGMTEIVRYCMVDDVGTVINPLLLSGQVHGGAVQGIGQIMCENMVWDDESGQMVSGSFMDYCMPRADDCPNFEMAENEVPSPTNPMGIKGAGEAGCVGAMPAVMNAVCDALATRGVRSFDMPASPNRIWQTLQATHAQQAAE